MRPKKRIAVLCTMTVMMAAGGIPLDGPLVCSLARSIECASDLSCGDPEFLGAPPTFLSIDFDGMAVTLLAPEERRGEVTSVGMVEHRDDRVLLSGIEGGRSFSMTILDDGTMSLTIADAASGLVGFGHCLPADQTRP